MFLRRCERRKNGKKHTYWALVESIRTARGSRQRGVAYLGELKKNERSGWTQLGRRLNGQGRSQPSLFDPPHYDDPTDDEPVRVKLKGVRLQRLRDFGETEKGFWVQHGRYACSLTVAARRCGDGRRRRVAWPVGWHGQAERGHVCWTGKDMPAPASGGLGHATHPPQAQSHGPRNLSHSPFRIQRAGVANSST